MEGFNFEEIEHRRIEVEKEKKEKLYEGLPDFVIQKIENGNFSKQQIQYIKKIPWLNDSYPEIDISFAQKTLEESHYGMQDVKRQMMRYIACQKHLGRAYGDVLLLTGPPGVGKTSIAKAVAKAMNRPFIKIPLAGISDAGPLRGYDSNYKDPKPGLIVEGIIEAGSLCPLILLDEIDKMGGSDSHGYPEHVLLHVLDSDRSEFIDDLIQIPIDLSNIVFLATANSITPISSILLNRLDIIHLAGYTKEEKVKILTNYIVPDLSKKLAVEDFNLELCDDLIEYLITAHSLEPGVRSLERSIKVLFESIIMEKYTNGNFVSKITVTEYKRIMKVENASKNKYSVKRRQSTQKEPYNY
ncbi:MAG TPA: hypothetical protein DEF65_07305 [Lachnospiraceae bacterium]|nr:hypothetical protein [Lachnospiraceae bacterium]